MLQVRRHQSVRFKAINEFSVIRVVYRDKPIYEITTNKKSNWAVIGKN